MRWLTIFAAACMGMPWGRRLDCRILTRRAQRHCCSSHRRRTEHAPCRGAHGLIFSGTAASSDGMSIAVSRVPRRGPNNEAPLEHRGRSRSPRAMDALKTRNLTAIARLDCEAPTGAGESEVKRKKEVSVQQPRGPGRQRNHALAHASVIVSAQLAGEIVGPFRTRSVTISGSRMHAYEAFRVDWSQSLDGSPDDLSAVGFLRRQEIGL
jgi:hypothetical protein